MQRTTSRRGKKVYTSYLIRESFRTKNGPRSRTICNVTRLPENVRNMIAIALKGAALISPDDLELSHALDYGGIAVLLDIWKRYDLDTVLAGLGTVRQRSLIKAMIFARLLFPSSKLALREQAEGTLLARACDLPADEKFDEDELYEAMDAMTGKWVGIEKALYNKSCTTPLKLVLYDLSSVYFEGKGPNGIARYGYSRDHRSDRPQVLLAVATDEKGVPIHLEVLRGNRSDNTTLLGLLTTLRRRFGIQSAVFVFDGGMSSRLNLDAMTTQSLRFVTRLSSTTLAGLLNASGVNLQMELGDCPSLMEIEHHGKRYVVAGGEWRRQRDLAHRNLLISKGEAILRKLAAVERKRPDMQKIASQVGRALQQIKAHKYFTYNVDEKGKLNWERKADLIEQENALDGLYLLHTNADQREMSTQDVLHTYKGLMAVESAFREVKSYLEVRPVFHHRPDRVRNHIRLCFLAYWISATLNQEWQNAGETEEVPRVLRTLQKIRIGIIKTEGVPVAASITQIPASLNDLLSKRKLLHLFASPPKWAAV